MRFYKYAIILVVIVALLTGVYLIVDKKTGSKDDTGRIELLDFDSENVKSMTIKNKDGEFVLEKEEDSWKLVSGGDFKVDSLKLNSIASTISRLYAERIIEEEAKDFEKYGLSDPVVLTLKTTDDQTFVVEIGNPTVTNESYYMRLNGENTVYTIPRYEGTVLNASKTDIRNKNIIDKPRSEIKRFGFEKDGELVFMAESEDEKDWKVTDPLEIEANIANVTSAIDAFIRTIVQDFVEEDAKDLSIYGLDNPLYAIEAETIDGERVKLLVGEEKGMNLDTYINEIYAMLEGTTEVFLVDIAPLNFLDKSLNYFVNIYVYEEDLEYMEGAYAKAGGKEFEVEIKRISDDENEDEVKEEYYVDGKKVSEDGDWEFKELFKNLMSLEVKEIDIDAEVPEEEPEALVTFRLNKEPKEITIELIPRDDETYYAMKNGNYTGLITDKESIDDILKAYDAVQEFLD